MLETKLCDSDFSFACNEGQKLRFNYVREKHIPEKHCRLTVDVFQYLKEHNIRKQTKPCSVHKICKLETSAVNPEASPFLCSMLHVDQVIYLINGSFMDVMFS